MASNNSTSNMISLTSSFIPNIILDSIGIGLCVIAICKTLIFILLILVRRQLTKSREKILFLLSLNIYLSIFVFALFLLDMFISMLKGHLQLYISPIVNDTLWCRLKVYLSNVALGCSLYSNTFQALHRFLRIVYYTRPSYYQNMHFYMFGILIQICLSALQPLPVLLLGHYQYQDYHCQIFQTNWRGVCIAVFLIWLLPVSATILIYAYTIRYLRHNSPLFTSQQRKRVKRDFIVIKRILWLVIFIVIFGIPACTTTVVYYIFGYIGWWANHLTWSIFLLSLLGMSIVQTCYSPHLHVLWARTPNQIIAAIE